jgi:hypothetical protein
LHGKIRTYVAGQVGKHGEEIPFLPKILGKNKPTSSQEEVGSALLRDAKLFMQRKDSKSLLNLSFYACQNICPFSIIIKIKTVQIFLHQ